MKTATIKTSLDIHIQCPHCDNWENTDEWTPRRKLSCFEIVEWLPEGYCDFRNDEYEVSLTKCSHCEHEFKLNWKY